MYTKFLYNSRIYFGRFCYFSVTTRLIDMLRNLFKRQASPGLSEIKLGKSNFSNLSMLYNSRFTLVKLGLAKSPRQWLKLLESEANKHSPANSVSWNHFDWCLHYLSSGPEYRPPVLTWSPFAFSKQWLTILTTTSTAHSLLSGR